MLISFHEDELDIVRIVVLKFLLQVAATVLIFAQSIDFSLKMFQLDVIEASVVYS